jgi:hypothetical protein
MNAPTVLAESARKNSCHHERHMSGIGLKVYNLFWRLSKKSKTCSIAITNQRIAKLIGARAGKRGDHITRVKTALVRDGWLEFQGVSKGSKTGTWGGGRYVPISHQEWSESKTTELGHSPCDPHPVQVKVSKVKPGGRAYKSKRLESNAADVAEVRTDTALEVRTVKGDEHAHRAGPEVRTDLVVGSTSTVRGGKYAQSVDLQTVERCVQLTPQKARLNRHRPTIRLAPLNPNPKRTVKNLRLDRKRGLRESRLSKLKLRLRNQHRNWNTLARRKPLRSLAYAGRMMCSCAERA